MDSSPAKRFCEDGLHEIGRCEILSEDKMEQNPMLNPVVLKLFFGVCKLEDLRRFRLVCPLWRDVSLERWREEMIVHIAFDEYFERRKNSNKRQRLHWKDSNILYQTPSIVAKPFRKYRLCYWQFPEVNPKRESLYKRQRREILNEFWINCGPWMKELHLKKTKIEATGSFGEAMTEFARNIVLLDMSEMFEISLAAIEDLTKVKTQLNLKSLKMHFSACDEAGNHRHVKPQVSADSWVRLFATFPKLQELRRISFDDVLCQNLLLAWSRLVEDESHGGRKLKISGYREMVSTPIDTLGSLFEHPDFAFYKVKICERGSSQERILPRVLENHQNTLKTLRLFGMTWNLNDLFRVPQNLTKATVQLDATPDFHFLKNLPTLKKLSLGGYLMSGMAEATRSEEMEGVQLEKLSHLQFCFVHCKPVVDIFVKCMPNLTVLSCPLTNEVFRVVCQHWRGLKEIDDYAFHNGILDDEGVTGIVPGEGSRLPNIMLLKYLRKFQTTRTLADKSVYNGFLQLEHLTDLDIYGDSISNEATSALSSKFGSQIFHAHQRSVERYFFDDEDDDMDELVEERLKVQMMAKDYGIILGDEADLNGDEVGYLIE